MLSWRCRRFRAQLAPAMQEAAPRGSRHRAGCPDCDQYARTLERAAAVRLPLPAGLASRLLTRVPAAPPGAGSVGPERATGSAAGAHTKEPRRIPPSRQPAAIAGPVPELPLPAALRLRLEAIGSRPVARPKPPFWLLDPRYTVAASLLLTVMLTWLVGNPAQLGFQAADTMAAASRRVGATAQGLGSRFEDRMSRWTFDVRGWIGPQNPTNRGGGVPPVR